jgi:hypothetical protein
MLSVRAYVMEFWDMMPCSMVDNYHYFATIFRAKEYGGKRFLQNFGAVFTVYTVFKPRRL